MRVMRSRACVAAALALAACHGPESVGRGPKPVPTIHRKHAGTLAADGWTVAESTGGHFRVELPFVFADLEMISADRAAMPAISHAVGGSGVVRGLDGAISKLRVEAACSSITGVEAPPLPDASAVHTTAVSFAGMTGFDADTIHIEGGIERGRVLRDAARLCIIQVDAFDGTPLPDDVVLRVFNSFRQVD